MNQNKIMFFCVGTGGHVLPVKNIIDELLNSGISKNQIEIVVYLASAIYACLE